MVDNYSGFTTFELQGDESFTEKLKKNCIKMLITKQITAGQVSRTVAVKLRRASFFRQSATSRHNVLVSAKM